MYSIGKLNIYNFHDIDRKYFIFGMGIEPLGKKCVACNTCSNWCNLWYKFRVLLDSWISDYTPAQRAFDLESEGFNMNRWYMVAGWEYSQSAGVLAALVIWYVFAIGDCRYFKPEFHPTSDGGVSFQVPGIAYSDLLRTGNIIWSGRWCHGMERHAA